MEQDRGLPVLAVGIKNPRPFTGRGLDYGSPPFQDSPFGGRVRIELEDHIAESTDRKLHPRISQSLDRRSKEIQDFLGNLLYHISSLLRIGRFLSANFPLSDDLSRP